MDPYMQPIAGISLERYAELGALISDHVNDPEAQARIVGEQGVSRADWEQAKQGWTARMQDMSLMGRVATAYMPLYQAALARKNPGVADLAARVSFEDYVAMSGCAKAMTVNGMLQSYGLDMNAWTQIAGRWNSEIGRDPMRYGQYGLLVEREGARIQAGGKPTPLGTSGAPVMNPPKVSCTHCGANLGPEDLKGTHCRYCQTVLPHQTAAAQQHLVVQKVLSNPNAFAAAMPVMVATPYASPQAYVASAQAVTAMVGKQVERSLKYGLIASLAITFVVAGVLVIGLVLH